MNNRQIKTRARLFGRNRKGATAIEFAFIAPVLFAIILATIDFGQYAWTLSTMQNAADEAARKGAVQGLSMTEVEAIGRENLIAMNVSNFSVSANNTIIAGANYLRVQVQRTYDFMYPVAAFQPTAAMTVTSEFPRP